MRHLLTLWLTATFLSAGIVTAILFAEPATTIPSILLQTGPQRATPPPATTPKARIARITSRLLVRKIGELRLRAIRLQLMEEGRELIEEGLMAAP